MADNDNLNLLAVTLKGEDERWLIRVHHEDGGSHIDAWRAWVLQRKPDKVFAVSGKDNKDRNSTIAFLASQVLAMGLHEGIAI